MATILSGKIHFSSGIRDLIVTLSSRGGSMLIGLAMQSLLAWSLGPEKRGEYAVCLIFSTCAAVVFTFGLDWASSYFVAAKERPFNQVITAILGYIFLIPIFMWPILYTLVHMPLNFFNQAPPAAFFLSIGWATTTIGFSIATSILSGLRAFKMLAVVSTAKLTYVLLVTAILTANTNLNILAPIWADLTGNLFTLMTTVFFLRYKWKWQPQLPELNTINVIFSYGFRMFGGSISMMANLRIGTVILAFFVSKNDLGYFALAMAILTQLGTIADSLNNILLPRIASSAEGRPDLVAKTARWVSTLIIVAGIFILLTSKWFVPILFSKEFNPAIVLLWILFPGMWLRSTCKILFAYFNGMNLPQIVSLNTFLNIFLNLILLLYCLPRWGIIGAAWVTTIVNIISTLFAIYVFKKKTQIGLLSILFVKFEDIAIFLKKVRILYSNFNVKLKS